MSSKKTRPRPPARSQDPDREPADTGHGEPRELAAWIFGTALLAFLGLALLLRADPTDAQRTILRFLMAVSAALLAYFFSGHIGLRGTLRGLAISASGGFVVFLLIQFVFDPFPPQPIPHPGSIRILQPADGDSVGPTTPVEWDTSYPEKNHYVLVTWDAASSPIVQDPTLVIPGGTWKGSARIGERADPSGTRFWLQIMATRAKLPAGPLRTERPGDARYSDRISVTLH